jgi:hypothetical protein
MCVMQSWRSLTSAISALLLAGTTLYAVCLNGHPSVAEEYKGAKAVVAATVVAERLIPSAEADFYEGTLYRIQVDKTFRGSLGDSADIFSENSSGRFSMTAGAKYLLFIHTGVAGMQVDYCGNSGLLSKRGKELKQVERLAAKR